MELDLVGLNEIADRLHVRRPTVDVWRHRGRLPVPRWTVSGTPIWLWRDIEKWARASKRLPG